MTKQHSGTLTFRSPINRETSYSEVTLSEDAESEIFVEISSNGTGYFEWEVEELCEFETGGLVFEDNTLTDYDGVFSLPEQLITYLEGEGYDMTYAK